MATEVRVKLLEGTTGVASAGKHAIVVDRSPNLGGNDLGFTGGELLFTSIGTCILTTLIGAARQRNVELTKVEFKVSGESGGTPTRFTSIHVDAVVEGNAPDEEIQKLVELAERICSVSNTVKEGAEISLTRHASLEAVATGD
jgi:putative redox protein